MTQEPGDGRPLGQPAAQDLADGRPPGPPAVRVQALDPGQRRAWRQAVREALGRRLADGAVVTGFLRDPDRYLVEPSRAEPAQPGPRVEPSRTAGLP